MTENSWILLFQWVFLLFLLGVGVYLILRIIHEYSVSFVQHAAKVASHHEAKESKDGPFQINKLNALEKGMLLMNRISPAQLVARVDFNTLQVKQYASELLWSVRQELDYNETQTLYFSPQLNEILRLAAHEVMALISDCADGLEESAPAEQLVNVLISKASNFEPCEKAKSALRQEASLLA